MIVLPVNVRERVGVLSVGLTVIVTLAQTPDVGMPPLLSFTFTE